MIYLISLPNHKKHQNISGNSLMSEKIYSRYFRLNEDLLLNASSDSNIKNKIKKIIKDKENKTVNYFKTLDNIFMNK